MEDEARGTDVYCRPFPEQDHSTTRVPVPAEGAIPSYPPYSNLVADMSVFAEEQRRMRLGESCRSQAPHERQPTPIPNLIHMMHTPEQRHYIFVPTNLSFYHEYSSLPANSHQRTTEMDNLARSLSQAHIGHVSGLISTELSAPNQVTDAHAEALEPRSFDERKLPQLWKDYDSMSL